jgi:Ca-activated chloride channel family protein
MKIDFQSFTVGTPQYVWALAIPAALAVLWVWRVARRRADVRHFRHSRVLPVRERFGVAGDLAFWLCTIVAASLCIIALAEPRIRIATVKRASADIVVLLDGSASMYVNDVRPDRWRRSVQFVRMFAESLGWKGDRVALALFSQRAAPQVRLTRDPNALFFFLDHLGEHSPFRLEDPPTWDTNLQEGVRWGLQIVETDEKLFGKSGNPKAFVVITDGQAWTGDVAKEVVELRKHNIPLFVVGVGTTGGGIIPEPVNNSALPPIAGPLRSVLDRAALVQIAQQAGGEYFEIGRDSDREVAFNVIDRLHRQANVTQQVESFEDLYWRFLLAAAVFLGLGTLLLRKPVELVWQAAGAAVAVLALAALIR